MDDIRWTFAQDMNLDGVVTISDVGLWIEWVFFLPGDLMIEGILLWGPRLAVFLELSRADFGGLGSGVVSVFGWLLVGFFIFFSGVFFDQEPK